MQTASRSRSTMFAEEMLCMAGVPGRIVSLCNDVEPSDSMRPLGVDPQHLSVIFAIFFIAFAAGWQSARALYACGWTEGRAVHTCLHVVAQRMHAPPRVIT